MPVDSWKSNLAPIVIVLHSALALHQLWLEPGKQRSASNKLAECKKCGSFINVTELQMGSWMVACSGIGRSEVFEKGHELNIVTLETELI